MTTADPLLHLTGYTPKSWDNGNYGAAYDHPVEMAFPPASYQTTSPIIGIKEHKWNDRPKSVPPTLRHHESCRQPSRRPCTAAAATASPRQQECNRVQHEATRKRELSNHLPLRKPRPPPWQKGLDLQPVPVLVTPAYVLARSKSKIEMNINTDQFFEGQPRKIEVQRSTDPERDAFIAHLQQQIDDLTLYLEEERLNHKDTKRKATEQLRDKVEEMTNQHNNHVKSIEEQHREFVEELNKQHQQQLQEQRAASDAAFKKLNCELEFLQGAFESYKSQLHLEMDER